MNYITVRLWGEELGRLVWNPSRRLSYFLFNPDVKTRPDVAPLMYPVDKWDNALPAYGDSGRLYQGLPPFIADSLPDSWGNKVFDQWVRKNRIAHNRINPLDKLLFIGQRGMGALEFEPAAKELEHPYEVGIDSLYRLSLDILEERVEVHLSDNEEITLNALMAVGSSAGGRQMKAILAINPSTGEIRSGQIGGLKDFEYTLVKFEDSVVPTSEIEMAFYEMASAAGIKMEECRLISVEDSHHFMTRRFDRKNGEKLHVQTLAAINPEANSYEELFATCRRLKLKEQELTELYRRMVFNIMANNTDDHNKNFSFILEKGEEWRLAPAYDMTFIFNNYGTGAQKERCLSLFGKFTDITKDDILEFASYHNVKDSENIIAQIAQSLSNYSTLAKKYAIPERWSHIIEKTLQNNLVSFGYKQTHPTITEVTDSSGNYYRNISVKINSRGLFEVRVDINGQNKKVFVKETSSYYSTLQQYELGNLKAHEIATLLDNLFTDS